MLTLLKTDTMTAPAYWACYFFNGDTGDMTDAEIKRADFWLETNGVLDVIDTIGEPYFTNCYHVHDTLAPYTGGDVQDYTVILKPEASNAAA